jgi:chromosome segregation ATPase
MKIGRLHEDLSATQHSERLKDSRIDELLHRLQQVTMDIDTLKIDLVTRDTEAESFRARINALRDEREALRGELKLMTTRAKDAELKLAREENRAVRLEDRLNTEVSGSVDKDTVIERRISEINRLKERLKSVSSEAREASRTMRANAPKPVTSTRIRNAAANSDGTIEAVAHPMPTAIITDERVSELIDDVRGQATAAADMLVNLKDTAHDDALRGELADIAAKMIAIVAQKEGAKSPIRSMISGKAGQSQDGRVSLSERASKLLHQE